MRRSGQSKFVRAMLGTCVVIMCIFWMPAILASESPLADAAEKKDLKQVGLELKNGSDPNAKQVDGMTALHWAAYHDDVATVKLLLKEGAQAKVINRYGVTPLALACTNGNGEIVEALLKAGADVHGRQTGGESPLMIAARTGNLAPVKALVANGAGIEAKDKRGQTALMWSAAEGHNQVVDFLIHSGAKVDTRLKSGFNAIFFAVREGHIETVETLLKSGVDIHDVLGSGGKTGKKSTGRNISALVLAVENGHFDLAEALLKAGADPNDQRSGLSPLHLLTRVRKPNRGDGADGKPPPRGSGKLTSLQFVDVLVKYGADVTARLNRGSSGGPGLGMKGATAFLLAAKTADLPLLHLLVKHGADPLLPNNDGSTPLMAAAGVGTHAPTEEAGTEAEALQAVEYIVKLGGNLDTVDKNGETAMHGAAYKSLPKMVHLLAEKGADIKIWNQKNKRKWTPLLIAQGFRPGNFKPSEPTIAALSEVMVAKGITPPKAPPRPVVGKKKKYP